MEYLAKRPQGVVVQVRVLISIGIYGVKDCVSCLFCSKNNAVSLKSLLALSVGAFCCLSL